MFDHSSHETHVTVTDGKQRYTVALSQLPRRLRRAVQRTPAHSLRRRVLRWGATAVMIVGIATAPLGAGVAQANAPSQIVLERNTLSLSNADATLSAADYSYSSAGSSVAIAGDVNGDGFADAIISAPYAYANSNRLAGEVYVVFGTPNGIPDIADLSTDLDGTNGFLLQGAAEYDFTGYEVSGAGDVNGDGLDDIIIGAYSASPNNTDYAGVAYVVFGSASPAATLNLASLTAADGFVLEGAAERDFAGDAVSGAGDVNNDGYADVVVGARGADSNGTDDVGAAYVVFGSASPTNLNLGSLNGSDGIILSGAAVNDYAGDAVSGAGDVNGDGFDDVLVGAPGGNGNTGAAYIVFGGTSLASLNLGSLTSSTGVTLNGVDLNDDTGEAVSNAGDVNGDGVADVIVGAYNADQDNSGGGGSVYIVFGDPALGGTLALASLDGSNGVTFFSNDTAGRAVSDAGDVNGDGFADVIVGARLVNNDTGAAYVVFGGDNLPALGELDTLDGSNGFTVNGVVDDDQAGEAVGGGGDVNGDGLDDLIVGARSANSNSGRAYVVQGAPQSATLNGGAADDNAGRVVADAGDVNGDGFTDVIIGAPNASTSNGAYSGAAYVVFGAANGIPTISNLATDLDGTNGFVLQGASSDDYAGSAVSGAGDVNGDGFADVIVGARYANTDVDDPGFAYVVFGSNTPDTTVNLDSLGTAGITLTGAADGDAAGYAVSGAGDVNGDGFADVMVGAPEASPNGIATGAAYVVFGSSSPTSAVNLADADLTLQGAADGDAAGSAVSGTGDVNGDGLDDVIVGAPFADPNGNGSAGEAYVVFSNSSLTTPVNLGSDADIVLQGVAANARTGSAVSGAGDVNGDGLDDLIIGVPGANPNSNSDAGEASVLFGSSTPFTNPVNIETGADIRLLGVAANDQAGTAVSGAGDVNGDGFADVIVGVPGSDGNGGNSGAAYVVFGSTNTAPAINLGALGNADIRLLGAAADNNAGSAVSGGGDVNGDGFADVIVGAPYASPNYSESGTAYVVTGGNFSNATTSLGTNASDLLSDDGDPAVVNGRQADDDLTATSNGANVIIGGQGDDSITVGSTAFARINGGTGSDTLTLDGSGLTLDLTAGAAAARRVSDLENLDVRGGNTLDLDVGGVLNLSDDSNAVNVRRDRDDTVNIGTGWAEGALEEIAGVTYRVFTQGAATLRLEVTSTPTPTGTLTATPTATNTPTATSTPTAAPATSTPTATNTPVPSPTLRVNFATGRAGSIFFIRGEGYTPNTPFRLFLNGTFLGTINTNVNGQFGVLLRTPDQLPQGTYTATLEPFTAAAATQNDPSVSFTIDAAAPLREIPAGNTDPIIDVPLDILPQEGLQRIFLPIITTD